MRRALNVTYRTVTDKVSELVTERVYHYHRLLRFTTYTERRRLLQLNLFKAVFQHQLVVLISLEPREQLSFLVVVRLLLRQYNLYSPIVITFTLVRWLRVIPLQFRPIYFHVLKRVLSYFVSHFTSPFLSY